MLTINAVSPLIMQDNFEMTLHIAVFKNIKQKKSTPTFLEYHEFTRRMVKKDVKMSFPL